MNGGSRLVCAMGVAVLCASDATLAAQHQHEHTGKAPERLGTVVFETTCNDPLKTPLDAQRVPFKMTHPAVVPSTRLIASKQIAIIRGLSFQLFVKNVHYHRGKTL